MRDAVVFRGRLPVRVVVRERARILVENHVDEHAVLAARHEDGAALLAEGLEVLIVAGGADLNLDPSDLGVVKSFL